MTEKSNIYLDGTYRAKFPDWHLEDSGNKAEVILEAIRRSKIIPNSVMEIGCGAGEILNVLHSKMADSISFHGYEISPQAYELCKTRRKERLTFSNEDALLINDRPKYDVVLCIDVFEHVENYIDFLRKLKLLGEYKIFRVPLDLNAKGVVTNHFWRSREEFGHLHYFTKELVLEVLNALDYVIVDAFFDTIVLEGKPRSLKNYLVRLINKLVFKVNQNVAARTFGEYFLMVTAK
jgi:methyltransferase family protein